MANFDLIIKSLDLSNSSTRDETLNGIIKYIVFTNDTLEKKQIKKQIIHHLDIEIHAQEIDESIDRLRGSGKIEIDKNNYVSLKSEGIIEIKKKLFEISEQNSERLKSFKKNIEIIATNNDYAIIEEEISELWEIFKLYIHDCYLTHGKKIIETLIDKIKNDEDDDIKKIFKKHSDNLKNAELVKILKIYVENYPDLINSSNLNYLTELANKTESFYSLGLAKEEYEKFYEKLKFDWIIFLDTNFIYSILGLHTHPEDRAAKYVIEIGGLIGIQFKYISKTYEELSNRKKDFDKHIPKKLEPSHIRTLLNSDEIDNFAKSYFEKKLRDSENTPHPSDVVYHSQNNLKSRKINIYNSNFEALSQFEDHILDQESKYNDFLASLDEWRIKKGLRPKGQKDPLQVHHDVFLREAILHLRKKTITSYNDAKYFGLTLDKTLIKFDRHNTNRKSAGIVIPTFFYPSFLLKRLLRYSPVKTDDYLRAFINTISTPAIENNTRYSNTAIKSVKYFHNMGIKDESLMLSCIKDETFLNNFEEKENNEKELKEFIESEINIKIENAAQELEQLKEKIKYNSKKLKGVSTSNVNLKQTNSSLSENLKEKEFRLKQFQKEFSKIRGKKNNTNYIYQFDIFDEIKQNEADKVVEDLESTKSDLHNEKSKNDRITQEYVKNKIRSKRIKGIFLILIAIVVIIHIIMVFVFKNSDYNYVSNLIESINELDDVRKQIIYIILGALVTIILYKLITISYKFIFDEDYLKQYAENIKKGLN